MVLVISQYTQMLTGYADLAFQFGLADENQAEYINKEMQAAAKLIADGKYLEADQVGNTYNSCSILFC